jgi:hypothetical protein
MVSEREGLSLCGTHTSVKDADNPLVMGVLGVEGRSMILKNRAGHEHARPRVHR